MRAFPHFFTFTQSAVTARLLPWMAFGWLAVLLVSCLPDSGDDQAEYKAYDLKSKDFRDVYDLQDKAMTDSLVQLFNNREPMIRYAAALAFASIKDTNYVDQLGELLKDDVAKVAEMAAYALGQTQHSSAEPMLIRAFRSDDTIGAYNAFNSAVLEAIGKCGTEEALKMLATISTYEKKDTFLLEGQSRGIYRFALRGIVHPNGTSTMVDYASRIGLPQSVRLIAANYLARAPGIDLTNYAYTLTRALESEKNPNIKMALVLAVGKTQSDRGEQLVSQLAVNDPDYRLRANAFRVLEGIGGGNAVSTAMEGIRDKHAGVSQIAARVLLRHASPDLATQLPNIAESDNLSPGTRATLFAAALKNMPFYYTVTADRVNSSLRTYYQNSKDPFEKEKWIMGLSYDPVNLTTILNYFEEQKNPYLKTNTLLNLDNTVQMAIDKPPSNFNRNTTLARIANFLMEALQSGDSGLIAAASELLVKRSEVFDRYITDESIFEGILPALNLPAEIEVYNSVSKALNTFFDRSIAAKLPEWNNPIDWELFLRLPDTVRMAIEMDIGEVRIGLTKNSHPGTVTNFVQLAMDQYYNDKLIHRVVPNFVIQGGCPRGDGYGSLGYTIRSELPPVYFDRGGVIGMASSGNHTESVQWFITHSPAMHLDGNYTNFGFVYHGMEVVHQTPPGTKIKRIKLLHE